MRWISILAARIGAGRSLKAKGALAEDRQGATASRDVQREKTAAAQTGAPHDDDPTANRTVRVFLSSTFLDMQRERDVLVRKAFPALRARFRPRGVELLEVDLRWGITQEQAESGTTLSICLSEIDRCRPHFVGLIGERHGWAPPDALYTKALVTAFPAIAGQRGASVTELEIIHGVLSDPRAAKRALFFMRDPQWVNSLPPEERAAFTDASEEARQRHARLKARIRQSGARVFEYASPEDIGAVLERELGAAIETQFPPTPAPDAHARGAALHEAYARERRGLYVGGARYLAALDAWAQREGAPPLVITGASGGGKSALIANWIAARRASRPQDAVIEHYLAASPDSADPALILRRIWAYLDRATGRTIPAPAADAPLMDLAADFARRLVEAERDMDARGSDIVIALDGLDKLSSEQNLRWWPRQTGPRVKLIVSCLAGEAFTAAESRGWEKLEVKPLEPAERAELLHSTLTAWGRELSSERVARILAHRLAGAPLFIKTVLEELRFSAINDRLDARIDYYLGAADLADLFARVLERLEDDSSAAALAGMLAPIWASRAGLEEADIVAVARVAPIAWAFVRNGLGEGLRDQGGRIAFAHDFLRQAVHARYLAAAESERAAHLVLADHFEAAARDLRQAEELPYQLRAAEAWPRLEAVLADLDRLALLRARGDVELIGYWLPLAERGRDVEQLLCAAFAAKSGAEANWGRAELDLAASLGEFLEAAGARGPDLQALGEQRTRVAARLLGADDPITLTSANNLAQTMLARGDLVGAERLFSDVLEARRRVLGPDHADTLSALNNLAQATAARGDLQRAETLQRQALEATTRTLGAEHADALTSRNNLAHILSERGDLAGARALLEAAYEVSQRQLGPEHPDTLSCAHNLASVMKAQGDLAGAQAMYERLLETRLKLLGPDHPSTLSSVNNLAGALLARGDLAGARALQERMLAATERLGGPDHPDTLLAVNNLAQTIDDLGDVRAAQTLFRRAIDGMTRTLGADHPATLSARNNLAQSLKASGDIAGAMSEEEAVLAARLRVSGPDHPNTLSVISNLAQTHLEAGDARGARELAQKAVDASTRTQGADHPETLTFAHNLASAELLSGQYDAAMALFERIVAARTRLLGPDHPDTLSILANQANALEQTGEPQRARAIMEGVVAARLRTLGANHPDTWAAQNNLASAMRACGDLAAARSELDGVLAAMQSGLGPEHPSTLSMLNNLASTMKALGDWEGAQTLEERVAEARQRVSGSEHPDTLTALNNLAQTIYSRGDAAAAAPIFERLLAARERVNGPEHLHTLACVINLAQCKKALGDIDGAEALERRALDGLLRTVGENNPLTLTAKSNLVGTLRFRGDLAGAEALEQQAFDARLRVLGPAHPDTLISMNALAEIKFALGDLAGARALLEPLVERRARTLGADHPDTLTSVMSLAAIVWRDGDLARAWNLFEQAHAAALARLGPDHTLTRHAEGALAHLRQAIADSGPPQ